MAGHSKWNNIKNRKGAADAKRGKLFSQVSKMIRIAVREGQSDDPQFNPALRTALDKARAANMPKDNIQRAIDRGMGRSASGNSLQEIMYEGFGPGGVAVVAVALTDNPNRTGGDVRFIFSRAGGSLGGPGSAMYMFERDNTTHELICTMPLEVEDPKQLDQLVALADNLIEHEDIEDVYCATKLPEVA